LYSINYTVAKIIKSINTLSLQLYTSSRLLIQLIQSELNEFGLTYPQYLVLSLLWEKDGLKVNEIGKKLSLDSGTLTPLLKKLEAMNYIKRRRGETDERTVHAELTYPGKSLQTKVEASISQFDKSFQKSSTLKINKLNQRLSDLLQELNQMKISNKWKS